MEQGQSALGKTCLVCSLRPIMEADYRWDHDFDMSLFDEYVRLKNMPPSATKSVVLALDFSYENAADFSLWVIYSLSTSIFLSHGL